MSIVSALPYTLTNGTTADATQVMANENQIVNNVNSNAATNGANSNITSLSGLTTPLSMSQGGTGLSYSPVIYCTSVSGTNTITATASPVPSALATGQIYAFIPANTNTGATTFNPSSLGAKNVFWNGAACVGGEIQVSVPCQVLYDGTQLNILSPRVPRILPAGIGPLPYSGATVPTGWLACDGSAISRTTYADLFAAIGTAWGAGDGSTTFNLPPGGRVYIGDGTATTVEACTASSSNGFTVASNSTKWITGMTVVVSNITGFTTSASAGTYYIYRASATNVRLCSTLAIAQNATTGSMETVSGTGTITLTTTFTARTLGDVGGEEAHAMSITELLAHGHFSQGVDGGAVGSTQPVRGNASGGPWTSPTTSTGGNAGMNIMQPFAVVKVIISY